METIITPVINNGVATASFSQYPKEFGNSWVHVTLFDDHLTHAAIMCLYINDKYPNGTIIISKYIMNDYPDMHCTLNKNFEGERIYTNPTYRKRGYWKLFATLMRSVLYNYNGVVIDSTSNRALAVERAYMSMMKLVDQKRWLHNNGRMFKHMGSEIEPPRDPAYPATWYNQRLGGIDE